MNINEWSSDGLHFIKVENNSGLTITFTNLGASVYSIYLNNEIMTMTTKHTADFIKSNVYYGKTIGRISNRIEDGKIEINNQVFKLAENEENNTLHGGPNGLSNQYFDYKIIKERDLIRIIFKYLSLAKEAKLPGNVTFKIEYQIKENETSFATILLAKTDAKTPINLTNHLYFCLGEQSLDNAQLQILSSCYIEPRKEDLIPLAYLPICSCLDFRKLKSIMLDIKNQYLQNSKTRGYDHFFLFDNKSLDIPNVVLKTRKHILEIYTDYEGVQIYSDNYKDDVLVKNTNEQIHRAIAIEPVDSYLSPNLITPNKEYIRYITYLFR